MRKYRGSRRGVGRRVISAQAGRRRVWRSDWLVPDWVRFEKDESWRERVRYLSGCTMPICRRGSLGQRGIGLWGGAGIRDARRRMCSVGCLRVGKDGRCCILSLAIDAKDKIAIRT